MAQPCCPGVARRINRSRTNMTDAEDMLPKRARMSRDSASAPVGKAQALLNGVKNSSSSRMDSPQIDCR